MTDENNIPAPQDHGKVVHGAHLRLSAAWIFPVLAIAAAGWLFWSHWRSEGPRIEIRFDSAPGIQANKTLVIYRGVEVGKVTGVSLDADLDKVIIKAQLKASAAHLAREKSLFWIDEPKVSLLQVSGLDAIIQGNSVQVRQGGGAPCTQFTGLHDAPLEPEDEPSLLLKLRAPFLPDMVRGAPLYYRGISVGTVKDTRIDANGDPYFQVVVDEKYGDIVRRNARFWVVPAAAAEIGPEGLRLDIMGVVALLQGGIAFDFFDEAPGEKVQDGAEFTLHPRKEVARATSPEIHIAIENSMGLFPGVTVLRYLGMPVGLVTEAHANFETDGIDVTARFYPGYDRFRRKGTTFAVVRPKISLQGVSGLETLVRGIYIDCVPGPEKEGFATHFVAEPFDEAMEETQELQDKNSPVEQEKFEITVTTNSTTISPEAPLFYRGIQAGTVVRKTLAPDGRKVDLVVEVYPEYAPLIRDNTKFWDVGGLKTSLGFFSIKIQSASISALIHGGLAFATPNNAEMGKPARHGQSFELNKSPRPEWLKWTPTIPAKKR